jgi:small subunit ribosomal protein S27e
MPGSYLRVRCAECGNERVVFGKASTEVACDACESVLVTPAGGKARIDGEVVETVERRPEDT